jgi:hypothetical protein
MRYICLAYEQEKTLDELSPGDWDSLRQETLAYVDELKRGGHHLASAPLESVRTATTIRVRNGRVSATDGPFAETRETLGGFFMIEARDLDEALQLAARWPSARFGSIEVRPIAETLRPDSRYGAPP